MLPSPSQLHGGALATATHASRRQDKNGQGVLNILRDLPPELQKKVLEVSTDGPGVPLLLVRNMRYGWDSQYSQEYLRNDDIFYIRLPDPRDGSLGAERFNGDNYPYDMIFKGIVNLADYDEPTTKTKFVTVRPTDGPLPDELKWKDDSGDDDEFGDYSTDVIELIDDAVSDLERTVDDRHYFRRNSTGDQLLFANFPTFKSHVAIVLVFETYD
jgi:hypothetical protein